MPEPRRIAPELVVFDVNETLSDLTLLSEAFASLGIAPAQAEPWFAGVLRDGFALTVAGENPAFAELATESLRSRLSSEGVEATDLESAVGVVMGIFRLAVHPDVVEGIRLLAKGGVRMVTLSNGSAAVARDLLEGAQVLSLVECLLSVEGVSAWKPHRDAYGVALDACGVAAGEAMLVAAHPWDIDGAARAGLRTAWLNREENSYPSYFRTPEVEVRNLVEFARLVTEG